jgi:hypothetical protein
MTNHGPGERLAAFTGAVTTPPVMAGLAATAVYVHEPTAFGEGSFWYVMTLLFLTAAPLLSYVLSYVLPSLRRKGRQGQRRLAFLVSVLSYILGTIACACSLAPRIVLGFFLSYLASGSLLTLINGALGFKASGHACGLAGPLTILTAVLGPRVLWAWAASPLVFWARLRMRRHSLAELVSGTLVGVLASGAVMAWVV